MFSNKKEKLQQQIKQVERDNRKSQRELERERTQLRRDEANIIAEIKKLAAQGNKESCAVLAKQLVKNRQQQARTYEMGARMNCLNSQQKMMATNIRMADSLKNTTTTMSKMNAKTDPAATAKIMKEFSKESMKMGMTEEAIDDALSNIMGDNEEEEDSVVQQVLDELGIETAAKIAGAPTPAAGSIKTPGLDTADIEAQLERLRSI